MYTTGEAAGAAHDALAFDDADDEIDAWTLSALEQSADLGPLWSARAGIDDHATYH